MLLVDLIKIRVLNHPMTLLLELFYMSFLCVKIKKTYVRGLILWLVWLKVDRKEYKSRLNNGP